MRHIAGYATLVAALVTGSGRLAAPTQRGLEGAYLAARDSAVQSLVARVKAGEPHAKYIAAHDSALMSLTGRLRVIIGPVHAKGFSGSGRINLDNLFPGDQGFGMLDALTFSGSDRRSVLWVTTRSLVSSWIGRQGRGAPQDLDAALRTPEFYTEAIESDAAIYDYATVTLSDAQSLGVWHAMLIRVGQDDSPLPPDRLLVTVVRGRMVYVVNAPVAAIIPPPRRCTTIRDSLNARASEWRQRYFGSNRADTTARIRAEHDGNAADLEYRRCYGKRVPLDPAFLKIIAQARAIAAALPK